MLRLQSTLLLVAGCVLVPTGCGHRQKAKPQLGEVQRWPRLETVFPERDARLAVRKTYAATVEAYEKVELCAQVRGVIKSLADDIDIGRLVRKDEVLLTLDIPDIVAEKDNKEALVEQARNLKALAVQMCDVAAEEVKEVEAQLKRFQADVEYRTLQYERVTRLAQGDTVAKQLAEENGLQLSASQAALQAGKAQVLTKQARALAARLDVKVAESRVKVAETELERLRALVGFATLRAPFDGVITKRWVDHGATVKDPGASLLTVMRTDQVRVIIDVPERDVPLITVDSPKDKASRGNHVIIEIPALQKALGIGELSATVSLRASALDPVTRTMRCEILLTNKSQLLKPQMTGTATVLLAERKGTTLPSSALVRNGPKVEIYYVAEPSGNPLKGIVKRTEVQLGLDDGQRVEILGNSLTGREHVIRKGSGMLRAGDYAIAVPVLPE
jgi:HlyD family secretion protein